MADIVSVGITITFESSNMSSSDVVVVPHVGDIDARCEELLRDLERRGLSVLRVAVAPAVDSPRDRAAAVALASGAAG